VIGSTYIEWRRGRAITDEQERKFESQFSSAELAKRAKFFGFATEDDLLEWEARNRTPRERDAPVRFPINGDTPANGSGSRRHAKAASQPLHESGTEAQSNGPEATLNIAPHRTNGRDGLTGAHPMRLKAVGTWWVGCVPCFNALTAIAIGDRYAVALNGSTGTWASRYSIEAKGRRLKVLEWSEAPDPKPDLLGQALSVEGCQMSGRAGSLERSFQAVAHGICMR
jgi:hypothetical protein